MDNPRVLNDVTQAIFTVSDHIPPSTSITMDTMLIADLALESVEIASLVFRLNMLYSVSLSDFFLEVSGTERISDFPVGRIVNYITDSLQPPKSREQVNS
jgi:hypothetical protein